MKILQFLQIFILSFYMVFTPTFAFAGAAEKWEYDVIPDQSQTLQIKGHKVDQYGAAVNDYDYNTKIDPKTAANRTKMGTVGMGRLLKTSGWGLLGAAALQALLDSVGWIMDPESQSIWRNKKPNSGGSVNCSGGFQFRNNNNLNTWFNCPLAAAQDFVNYANTTDNSATYTFVRFDSDPYTTDPVLYTVRYEHHTAPSLSKDMPNQRLTRKPDPNAQPEPKEILTPEALADYANHTHPDYSNPELAPKLEPKYSPEIQTDLWKPSNPWEDTNSPTVQEVKKELEKAPPEPKKEPEITPNPETGGFALPAFCSWASPVCEFIKWFKDDEIEDPQDDKPQEDNDVPKINANLLTASGQCPPDLKLDIPDPFGGQHQISFSYSTFCTWLSYTKPWVLLTAHIIGISILGGRGSDSV